ncbi:hypothetical protein FGW37_24980 [Streptomyces rectiverticillatus]|uniref:pPIWI_RE_Y domain-containing protein n=1 Tax=Streptomyces rectiverticillatus TaxID=173860 RepID=UPI0015C3452C|nr:hypothetical protein [Streptomyces rectiverticillatus]QLE74416.1 hypothetical protein FGW37_24980 [Streptomyces rectiverticillatus]
MTGHERTGVGLLAGVARGVVELLSVARSAAFRLPYPTSLQLALDRLVLAGLMQGHPVPSGVPELLSWCREREPTGWPLTLPTGFLTAGTRLIHPAAGEPTRTCAELASLGPDGVLEQEAESLLDGLADACGTVDRFAVCRDFLISRPVILRYDPMELLQPGVAQIWRLVKELYASVPDRFPADGLVHRCTGCLLLAKPRTAEGPWCEGGCTLDQRELEPSHQPEQTLVLPLALRLFLALPGRTERTVRSRLTEQARLLPFGLGAHRITGQDGKLRVFQVHDRIQPVPAALRAAEIASRLGGPLDIVVPDRLVARPGYRQGFDRALPVGAQVRLLSTSEFIAPRHISRPRRNHA